jgi:cytochrome c553
MKILYTVLLCVLSLFSADEESFISDYEYAKMLYANPRGIGCVKCHGEKGRGEVIARYVHKGKPKTLIAPKINDMKFDEFIQGFKKPHKVMPKYFLTDDEIKSIYYYLTSKEEEF